MDELNGLFEQYRAVTPDPEPSAAFMPGIWRGIERRRGYTVKLWNYARGLVTASAAACLLLLGLQFAPLPQQQVEVITASTYVDALGAEMTPETTLFAEFSLGE